MCCTANRSHLTHGARRGAGEGPPDFKLQGLEAQITSFNAIESLCSLDVEAVGGGPSPEYVGGDGAVAGAARRRNALVQRRQERSPMLAAELDRLELALRRCEQEGGVS